MDLNTAIYLVFALAAAADLAVMLLHDMAQLQQCGCKASDYYDQITGNDEYLTVKRIIALVVLIGSVTSMALESPYVVALLTLVLLAQAVALWRNRPGRGQALSTAVRRLYWAELALMVVVMIAVVATNGSLAPGLYNAGVCGMAFVTFSYAVTCAAAWLMGLTSKKK